MDEKHWQSTRLDWATLLKRVYNIDVLACPCGGRLKFEELVIERAEVREHFVQRGLSPNAPRRRYGRTTDERDAYMASPPEDWDQSDEAPAEDWDQSRPTGRVNASGNGDAYFRNPIRDDW